MDHDEEKKQIQWQPIIEMLIILVTVLGSTIPLYLHTDAKLDSFYVRTQETIEGIRQDMRDFHGRLERQDAEFKGKLALQDAEFKAHMMNYHSNEERNRK